MPYMAEINLVYYHDDSNHGNFGDELSPYIVSQLLSSEHTLVKNQEGADHNILCIGSLLHDILPNYHVFGTGFGLDIPETLEKGASITAVRGPLSRDMLLDYGLECPESYGDAALLLPLYYQPKDLQLQDKVGFIPHFRNYHTLGVDSMGGLENAESFYLIDPTNHWKQVIDEITSCKSIVSQALHGLICADAYDIPNVWFSENLWFCNMCHTFASHSSLEIPEDESVRPPCSCGWKFSFQGTNLPFHNGNFKFHDYFLSQNREINSISCLDDYDEAKLYCLGNQIDLESLRDSFPL
jgi:pyruvyltransferase